MPPKDPFGRPDQAALAHRRAVEALAETLYQASDTGGIPWARRSSTVRSAWLDRARDQLAAPPA